MKQVTALLLFFCFITSVSFVSADDGMWTFDNPPLRQWKEKYGFEPTQEWLDKVRLASPKVGGASGGFVSPNGLIATNHHVAADIIKNLSTKERDLVKNGFYAATMAAELKAPAAEATVLVSYENVTKRVQDAALRGSNNAEMAAGRTAEITAVEKFCTESTGLKCDVISLYSGGEYWLYRSKRYTDIRLVMAPEEQAAFFGGDYDNFTFPRYDLDFAFLRAYENGKPASTPHFFKWSATGAKEGEFVMASGYPGSTARLMTVAQLAYARDFGNPLLKDVWETRRKALEDYSKLGAEQFRQASDGMRSLANSLKRLQGQQDGLSTERMFAKKVGEEKDLRDKLEKKSDLNKLYEPAWGNISKAYSALPSKSKRIAYSSVSPSKLASFALQIVRYHQETGKPNDKRYAEFRDSRLAAFKTALMSTAPIYLDMEEAALTSWLAAGRRVLGADDPFVKAAIGDADPSEVARRAVRETRLIDPAVRKALLDGGADAIASSTDPMITLARRVEPVMRELRKWEEENITNLDAANGTKIAQARFAVYGRSMPPDANSQLRISSGTVKGYDEDTTLVPFRTTYYGLYDRAAGFNEKEPFNLSTKIKKSRSLIDLSTPLNFVYSADTIGGNSGSPVINRNAEMVGLNFDSNLQKLSNRYWYIDEQEGSRAVAVDSAGILEALKKVYRANRVVTELMGSATGKRRK